ncbi:MAG: hypothetical protein N2712_00700 [Brevinematales bacterium]|nr:hypothetical protein [Brevinematales bacterium]
MRKHIFIFLLTITVVLTGYSNDEKTLNLINRILIGYNGSKYIFQKQISTNSWVVQHNYNTVFILAYPMYVSAIDFIEVYNDISTEKLSKALLNSGYYDSEYNEYGVFSIMQSEGKYVLIYLVKIDPNDISTKTLIHAIHRVSEAITKYKGF